MQIALCHENILPRRGGAEMYVADLTRRLVAAGHDVHLYASQWDYAALPKQLQYHSIAKPRGGRAMRPWQFSESVKRELHSNAIGTCWRHCSRWCRALLGAGSNVKKDADGNIFDAFTDPELRYRMRYVDLTVNTEFRQIFIKRTKLIKTMRNYLPHIRRRIGQVGPDHGADADVVKRSHPEFS